MKRIESVILYNSTNDGAETCQTSINSVEALIMLSIALGLVDSRYREER